MKYLTTGQISRSLGVAPRTVKKWCDSGELPNFRVNTDRRIRLEDAVTFALDRGLPLEGMASYQPGVLVLSSVSGLADELRRLLPSDWLVSSASRLVGAGVLLARRRWTAILLDGYLGAGLHEVLAHLPATQPDVPCGLLACEDGSTELSHAERERLAWLVQRPVDVADVAQTLAALVRKALRGGNSNGHAKVKG